MFRLHRPIHQGNRSHDDALHWVAIKFHERMMWPLIAAWALLFVGAVMVGLDRLSNDPTPKSPFSLIAPQSVPCIFFSAAFIVGAVATLLFFFSSKGDFERVVEADRQLRESDMQSARDSATPANTNQQAQQPGATDQ